MADEEVRERGWRFDNVRYRIKDMFQRFFWTSCIAITVGCTGAACCVAAIIIANHWEESPPELIYALAGVGIPLAIIGVCIITLLQVTPEVVDAFYSWIERQIEDCFRLRESDVGDENQERRSLPSSPDETDVQSDYPVSPDAPTVQVQRRGFPETLPPNFYPEETPSASTQPQGSQNLAGMDKKEVTEPELPETSTTSRKRCQTEPPKKDPTVPAPVLSRSAPEFTRNADEEIGGQIRDDISQDPVDKASQSSVASD